ncbi:hypothetical protein BYT27DRAFT_6384297 [Phlegmacium glaucopus]|nr:hypothetical protein BYT27DRAFT_6384297 [Phlegmacium glaucopus]
MPPALRGSKRKLVELENAIQSVNLDRGWIDELLALEKDDLALVLGDLVNRSRISNTAIKRARSALPSFSAARWAGFAKELRPPLDPEHPVLRHFATPSYWLPPSFHEAIFENSWRTQDVYREKSDQTREEARIRILDPYIIPILALFHGRINDKPEQTMPETKYSTGGQVEHEVIMIGGVLFFIMELKHEFLSPNNLAELFLELLSAASINEQADFAGLRVYGLLTDLTYFKFYSYDPQSKKFCLDQIFVVDNKRWTFALDMIDVTNKIFGLILSAFVDGLHAIVIKSNNRAANDDFSPEGSAPTDQLSGSKNVPKASTSSSQARPGQRQKSTSVWESALKLAEECCAKFAEKPTTIQDMERNSNEALELLTKSVHSIPRFSEFTGTMDPSTIADLRALARDVVSEKCQNLLAA